jgi:uncharacterized secreted protein with C-terminal beta-propeller domain
MKISRQYFIGLTLGALVLASTGCTAGTGLQRVGPDPRIQPLSLVTYDSCDGAISSLKAAARTAITQYRRTAVPAAGPGTMQAKSDARGSAAAAPPGTETSTPDYSGTNVHEPGVDEPDIVKTDGKRIITVANGVLHTVDAVSRRGTGELLLPSHLGAPAQLLLRGDRALVLFPLTQVAMPVPIPVAWADQRSYTSDVLVVDLSGQSPRLEGTLTVDGSVVDARQAGGTARVVVRSTPRVDPQNPATIDMATISDWLPRFSLNVDGRTRSGSVDCRQISRPARYSGLAMLTVYSLDLDAPSLTIGEPASVVADGGVVYGTGTSLYIAADDRWMVAESTGQQPTRPTWITHTQIYEFDVSRPGRPVFEASGEVPGTLINQYAMSEYDRKLRVVTTTAGADMTGLAPATSESALRVLQRRGEALVEVGRLEGMGKGERVYSVRFVGPTGYVVTFRQTDPLYVVDLRDPANPAAVGELQLTGYSAYLHPTGDGRLIGVGQEASVRGRVLGTQVSLFDVRDPSKPGLLARYQLNGSLSEAEADPHAFLFWPKTGLVLIPVTPSWNGALALTVDGTTIREFGRVGAGRQIRRSLVIGDTLWTVTETGLGANDLKTLTSEGWIPF